MIDQIKGKKRAESFLKNKGRTRFCGHLQIDKILEIKACFSPTPPIAKANCNIECL
jgi:hypothetical protein